MTEPPLPQLDEHASIAEVAGVIRDAGVVLILRESFPIGLLTPGDLR
ncbi:MAG: hypothetical protein Q7W30_08130 [Coriobacteriia bacterium]|nr:hypothetical protein [Coriobacteriia bacterium]